MSWVGIAPLVFLYGRLIGDLAPGLTNGPLRAALIAGLVVPTMAYVVGPVLTRLCRPWLYPGGPRP